MEPTASDFFTILIFDLMRVMALIVAIAAAVSVAGIVRRFVLAPLRAPQTPPPPRVKSPLEPVHTSNNWKVTWEIDAESVSPRSDIQVALQVWHDYLRTDNYTGQPTNEEACHFTLLDTEANIISEVDLSEINAVGYAALERDLGIDPRKANAPSTNFERPWTPRSDLPVVEVTAELLAQLRQGALATHETQLWVTGRESRPFENNTEIFAGRDPKDRDSHDIGRVKIHPETDVLLHELLDKLPKERLSWLWSKEIADHVAANSPLVTLAVLDEIDRLTKVNKSLAQEVELLSMPVPGDTFCVEKPFPWEKTDEDNTK